MRLFDAQVRLGECLYDYWLDLDQLTKQMDRLDIGRAILCPIRPRDYAFGPANDFIAATVRTDPDRFTGFARVDPWLGEAAIAELQRGIVQLKLRGLLLDPWEDHFVISDPLVDPLVESAAQLKIPIMIAGGYTNFSHPGQIAALAARHPEVLLIATHGGQLNISGLLLADAHDMLQSSPNVIIETSGIYREDFIEDCIAEFGPDRVIFGSSTPIFNQELETLRIRHAHLSDEIKQRIGWQNIVDILERVPKY